MEQRDDVLTSKRELESIIRNIQKEMTTIFVAEFAKIDHYFGEVFTEMFGGGKGQLILEDPENPLTCGIEIRGQPPGTQLPGRSLQLWQECLPQSLLCGAHGAAL